MDVHSKFYLAIRLDRAFNSPVFISSRQGGTNIEDIDPNEITFTPIDVTQGPSEENIQGVYRSFGLGQDIY